MTEPTNHDPLTKLISDLLSAVEADADRALTEARSSDDPYLRRAAFRTAFAAVETRVYVLKQLIVTELGESQRRRYTNAELAMLREESYALGEKGDAYTTTRYLPLASNIRFMLEMIVRETDIPLNIDWGSSDWQTFNQSLRIRHRLTHPKTPDDACVSAEQFALLERAYRWFLHITTLTVLRALRATRHQTYRLRNACIPDRVLAILDRMTANEEPAIVVLHGALPDDIPAILSLHKIAHHVDGQLVLTQSGKDYLYWRRNPPQE